ncbi:DNA polymerase Y family protein [Thermomonas aquatica]|uniref:DNA polymerase n=1 Tax=Thermomonas aquatica TaxID=2202149 RepID=A0A5B7ZS43_9GAMM|nr:DNA polymerase [Thermomonas aquatica]QDA57778.1 DNA polymerase [Thermomonas aquatica]
MTLRCLFVDFDSFFASVEQNDAPHLRGRPVAVIPVASTTTCCIAASKEAKRDFGIKTGTGVAEALERCPDIALQIARPARYVRVHHQFLAAIQTCIPHGKAASVDEVPCWLIGRERRRDNAVAIARNIKRALRDTGFSDSLTCSIGIAPNKFLAKTASDMNKPDGLTVIEQADLPHALHGLELRDLCGIGPSMEARLQRAGIGTVERLCAASRDQLRRAWGSIEGERFWLQLRGFELPERETQRASVGHSHVLGPELRDAAGMRSVLFKLLAKAAMRLRDEALLAGGMAIRIRFVGMDARFERDLRFAPLDDTPALLQLLGRHLRGLERAATDGRWNQKRHPPLSVAVTLVDLSPRTAICGELMAERQRAHAASLLLDKVNRRYGNSALYLGSMAKAIDKNAAPMRIPFQQIPKPALEEETGLHGIEQAPTSAADLLQVRMNQFKVLAEKTHRERDARRHRPSGAGGWGEMKPAPASPQAVLF